MNVVMAKFFITNDSSLYEQIKQSIAKSKFKLSFDYANGDVYALAVRKLMVDNCNYAQEKEDFAVVAGTCIYKEEMEYSRLLTDFDGNIQPIRNNTIGQYAVCCKKGAEIYAYSDSFACFDVFYYHDVNKWLMSNSLYDMSLALHDDLHLNKDAVATFAINPYGLLNGTTYFKEIKRLQRDEFVHISLTKKTFEIESIELPFPVADDKDFDKMVKLTANALRENARISAKVFGTPTVCTTGGLDSRLIISSYLSAGVKPLILSGKRVMAGKWVEQEDTKVARMIAKKYGLSIKEVDFSWSDPVNKNWDELIPIYGIPAAYMYGGQKTILNSLTNESTDVITFGWGGEPYREDMRCKMDLEDNETADKYDLLLDYYKASFCSMHLLFEQIPNYADQLHHQINEQAQHVGIKNDLIKAEELWCMTVAGEAQGDTQVVGCLQQNKYCYLPLFEYNALKNRVHPSLRKNAKFMLAVMKELCPSAMEIPFYTRQAWNKVDVEDLSIHIIPNKVDVLYDKMSWLRNISSDTIKRTVLRPIKRMIYGIFRPSKGYPVQYLEVEQVNCSCDFSIEHNADPISFYRYELLKKIICHYLNF